MSVIGRGWLIVVVRVASNECQGGGLIMSYIGRGWLIALGYKGG